MALLRAVAFGWQQAILTENATRIRDVGMELHKRLSILSSHAERLGKHLEASVESYNRFLGSMERSVVPSAKRLAELGIESGRAMPELAPLETSPRTPMQAALALTEDLKLSSVQCILITVFVRSEVFIPFNNLAVLYLIHLSINLPVNQ
jgi:DNA recombination protein RmuC